MKKRRLQASAVVATVMLLAVLVGACAGVNVIPIQQNIARAETAIDNANRSEAGSYAPLEVNLAEQKLSDAKTALENKEYRRADWLAEEALAEANLAEAKARSAKTRSTVQALRDTLRTLENELERRP